MKYLIILFLSILFIGCNNNKGPVIRDIEIDASRDTTIIVEKRGYFDGAILKVVGNINDNALILMRHPDERNYFLYKDIHLSKGDNNCRQTLSDLYDARFHIVYYHQNVSQGKLKLNVQF